MGIKIPYLNLQPNIAENSFIAENVYLIGDVVVDEYSSIWYNCILRGDVAKITVGKNTNIQDGTIIHVTKNGYDTIIGDNVTIGHKALIHACRLEDNSFIGMGSIILDNARVCTNGMLAAGSLLTGGKIVPSGELWAGSPAKFMRKLTDEDIENIAKSAEYYVKLSQNYIVGR